MTNETVVAYTFVGFPNVFADPKKVDRTNVGYSYKGLFNNGVAQIPSFGGTGGPAKRRWSSIPVGLKQAARRRVCSPTSGCPASATRLPR